MILINAPAHPSAEPEQIAVPDRGRFMLGEAGAVNRGAVARAEVRDIPVPITQDDGRVTTRDTLIWDGPIDF